MDTYGLIGYPLGHSFSRDFFTDKFASEDIDAEYQNFEISDIDQFPDVLVSHPRLKGLNVTIPYKQKIIPFLDSVSAEARAIGAVNVVKVKQVGNDKELIGYNSDVIGFTDSIRPLLKPMHKQALILGTGGASKAIDYALREKLGIETVFVSRYARPGTITYADITAQVVKDYPVIVNCTPVGMYPRTNECPQLPYEAMTPNNLLYDLVYNPSETLFLSKGKQQGATVKNGLEMLILQALASWNFWNE